MLLNSGIHSQNTMVREIGFDLFSQPRYWHFLASLIRFQRPDVARALIIPEPFLATFNMQILRDRLTFELGGIRIYLN